MRPVSEADEAREARARQMAVSVRGVYGGFWITHGADQGMLDGKRVTGLGVRITKGMHTNFAFETDFIGAGRAKLTSPTMASGDPWYEPARARGITSGSSYWVL